MVLPGFANGSGMSTTWVNHFVLLVTGTLVVVAAAALVAMLMHRFDAHEESNNLWIVGWLLFVLGVVFVVLGFLNSFWL